MHHLKRFFLILIVVLLISGSLLTASAEDLPAMSPSIGVGADPYDTHVLSVGSLRFLLFSHGMNIFSSFNLAPDFPVSPIPDLSSGVTFDSADPDFNYSSYGTFYTYNFVGSFTDSSVPSLLDGLAYCDYSCSFSGTGYFDTMVIQLSDFYCWSHNDLYSVDSELSISTTTLLSYFDSALITYSSAGDITVNQVTLDVLPLSWANSGNIMISPDLWDGSDDLYYVYDVKVFLDFGEEQYEALSVGTITNCFRSDLRQLDISAALPSPPDIDPGDSVGTVLGLLSSVGDWFVDYIPDLVGLFWLDNSLTLFGVISVLGFGLFVVLLIAAFVSSLLRFR